MPTETATTLKTRNSGLAIIAQSAIGTFADPGTNYLPTVGPPQFRINGVEVNTNEMTGSIEGTAPDVLEGAGELSFEVNLRGPGGADVPAANAFVLGILLQAAKMTENRVTTAIPASPEAVSAASTGGFDGTSLLTTVNLYRGLLVHMASLGTLSARSLIGIRANNSNKTVTFARLLSSTPTGNYQIPKQLAYSSSMSSTDPLPLSAKVWLGGRRYDLVDCALSAMSISIPTSGRDQATNPTVRVTMIGRVHADADEATPTMPQLGTVPKFRDGQQYFANVYIAGSGVTVESGAQTSAAPDPNKPDGSGAQELAALNRSLQLNVQSYLKADLDLRALARAQARHAFYACYGAGAGQIVGIVVADARVGFSGPDGGGNEFTETPPIYIDALDKNVSIVFAGW